MPSGAAALSLMLVSNNNSSSSSIAATKAIKRNAMHFIMRMHIFAKVIPIFGFCGKIPCISYKISNMSSYHDGLPTHESKPFIQSLSLKWKCKSGKERERERMRQKINETSHNLL